MSEDKKDEHEELEDAIEEVGEEILDEGEELIDAGEELVEDVLDEDLGEESAEEDDAGEEVDLGEESAEEDDAGEEASAEEEGEEGEEDPVEEKKPGKMPSKNILPAEAALGDDVAAAQDFFNQYGKLISLFSVLLIVSIVSYGVIKTNRTEAKTGAGLMLRNAKTPETLLDVVNTYPDEPAALIALWKLGNQNFADGKVDDALKQFLDLQTRGGDSIFKSLGKFGELYCLESLDKIDEASAGFKAFADADPTHFLYPKMLFGHARCLAQQGKFAEAQAIYDGFATDPAKADSRWKNEAERQAKRMDREARAAASK